MYVVALAGSPSATSRSLKLAEQAKALLAEQQIDTLLVSVYDFPAEDLLYARFDSPAIKNLRSLIANAAGVVIATPIYKAAYSGALKTLLDLLPEDALANKPTLPLASGGTAAHLLALDYALKPVLTTLKARDIQQGVFAIDKHIGVDADGAIRLEPELDERLRAAVSRFAASLKALHPPRPLAHELRNRLVAGAISL
ncbi:NADPH-dependent FMN reductase [Neisseriaceae bacterium JH1-16]|nr:NADPH-dependent FMN reductase [Neisseriaceae bacterium JH1-16]